MPRTGFVVAWVVFWLLMFLLALQDAGRRAALPWWQPLLWEGSSCLVSSLFVWSQWRRIPRLDGLLQRPWAWFGRALWLLPLAAPAFVAAIYGLRHAVYAALGLVYRHEAWGAVLVQESLKFTVFYGLFVALVFGIRSHAAMNAAGCVPSRRWRCSSVPNCCNWRSSWSRTFCSTHSTPLPPPSTATPTVPMRC